MESNRWIIERAGLLNFWYYDEEEFTFSDGRLLLRGSNGSGKSVTMQSLIPLLLDGNRSPERLDPFGSKARKMENYLLGEDENGRDESTAYLFIEFKKQKSGNYLTIGMGFKAVRNKPLQSWGFSITDGRRVGRDFIFYKDMGEKIPLSKKELVNRIGQGGRVTDGQNEYMKMVNDLLFGFDEIDEYDELIKLLVQLRSPKLSKDFKPTVIYEILENSLQQLSEDDLRPMSEAIENMDNIKSRLEELKESKKASDRIKTYYGRYNNAVILEKAKTLVKCSGDLEKLEKEKYELEGKKNNARDEFTKAESNIENFKISLDTAGKKREELERHDSIRIKEKIIDIEKNMEDLKREKGEKERQMEDKKKRRIQEENKLKEHKIREEVETKKIEGIFSDMDELAEGFAFDEQSFMKDELSRDMKNQYEFTYVKTALKQYVSSIERAAKAIEEKDRKNSEYDRILKELEKSRQDKTMRTKKLDETEGLLEETKQELIEKVYSWTNGNTELIVSNDCLKSVSRCINNFDINSSYDEIIALIRDEYNIFESGFNRNKALIEAEQQSLMNRKKDIEQEIMEWKNKKEPEPIREGKVIANRKRLGHEKIPYVPLYRGVDFAPGISEEVKGRIEEALADMGILDALIVPERYKGKIFKMDKEMADKYLFASPQFLMHGLSEFLRPENVNIEGITSVDIENVLQSILLDENGNSTYIDENGRYGMGLLKGRASHSYSPKLIGVSARKRYREEMISSLTDKCQNLQGEIDALQSDIDNIKSSLSVLKREFNVCPKGEDMQVAVNEVREARYNLEKISSEVLKREGEEKNAYRELKAVEQRVYELTCKINIKVNLEVYEEAISYSREYTEFLYELEKQHLSLVRIVENIKRLSEVIEQIEIDIDNIAYDRGIIDRKLRESQALYHSYTDQLKLSNYEEIKNEIEGCIRLIKELPEKIEKEISRRESQKAIYNSADRDLINLCSRISVLDELLLIYKASFKEETDLGYVVEQSVEEDLVKNAKHIMKEIEDKFQRDEVTEQLFARYQENSQYLREYIVKIDSIFEKVPESENPQVIEALGKCRRLNITGKVRGRDVDFYKLLEFINEGIDENERLLKESDRQLFEDILVKNISKKIRAKIYHSQQWVKKMNELMESMNTSSGLSFSLSWSSKKAETEDQLDTKELVELLKGEGSLMKEEDLNKLSEHFRSKIAEARRIQEDTGKTQTFHTIMKAILDYRKWFEFRLHFTKTGQNRKELTNNAFYQFSGGEKAMAMYVPLFSAVYARYEGARVECPRIISLDEAFAGVDEKNISDMFRLLNELRLDFVINSQILWGDYDTVPSLSICELIRPDNADFVTVIRYLWNGRAKQVVA